MSRVSKETEEPRGLVRIKQGPSKKEIYEINRKVRAARAEVAKLREPLKKIIQSIKTKSPLILHFLNDIHYGSDTVDYDLLDKVVDFIEKNEDIYALVLGDAIEGSKPQYRTIESHRTGSVTEEVDDFQQAVLERIAHKIILAIGHYFGHTGWAHDGSGVDLWNEIFSEYEIPVTRNGSTADITVEDASGEKTKLKVDSAHYYQGKSRVDALHSLREHWKAKKGADKPDIVAGAHIHQAAVGIEYYPGAKKGAVLIQSGTYKGVNPNLPEDSFAGQAGLEGPPGRPGQSVILARSKKIYRAMDLDQTDLIHTAIDFYEKDQPLAIEAIERANDQSKPDVKLRSRKSKPSLDREHVLTEEEQVAMLKTPEENDKEIMANGVIYSENNLAPLYDTVSYNITTDWPILFLPIANVRIGSSYEGLSALKTMVEEFVLKNPHVMVAFLGNVIDTEVSKKEDRVQTLDVLADLVNLIGSKQVLALLLDSSLRNANWRKKIGDVDYVPPGTYLSEKTGVPLVPGGSSIELFHGSQSRADKKSRHSIMLLDGLKRHGSYSKALMGLTSYDSNHNHAGHDVLVSGHHPHAAVGTYQKGDRTVDLIDVGWLSPFDNSSGKKNVQRTARGGQGLIINKDMRIPTGDWGETVELFSAILALTAARKFGMIDTK